MVESQSVSDIAPTISIGTQTLQSVEYPGAIGPSPKSLQKALRTLGKQGDWDKTFNKETTNLELRFRPENRWAHPVIGDRVQCHRLLMKVTRRRRKRRTTTEQGVQEGQEEEDGGVYKVDVRGVIKQTVRYRGQSYGSSFAANEDLIRSISDGQPWPTINTNPVLIMKSSSL
jgi:general transcription factor 3C polypeptide 5 (transcription factor C subunit 1)